jgi:hypothetical protein
MNYYYPILQLSKLRQTEIKWLSLSLTMTDSSMTRIFTVLAWELKYKYPF